MGAIEKQVESIKIYCRQMMDGNVLATSKVHEYECIGCTRTVLYVSSDLRTGLRFRLRLM